MSGTTVDQGNGAPSDVPPMVQLVIDTIDDQKASGLLVLDVREVASFTDFIVICTAGSDRHGQAVVDAILAKLREVDEAPLHKEGYEQAAWILVDFVDFLVNVFTADARAFYQLEGVWRDAPVVAGERQDLVDHDDAALESVSADDAALDPATTADADDTPAAGEAVDG